MDFFKKNTTSRYPTDILIGELFVKAGIITQKQLDDTVRSAGAKHLHIGQMLVMSGYIKQRDIDCAVDAQSLLRDKVVEMSVAARCLKIAVKTGASVMQLVKEEQALGSSSAQTNRLGELLMEAGIINRGQLSAAMQRSMSTGLPLGRILVLNNSLVDSLLRQALELQVRVRDEMMERTEAIDVLRAEATKLGMKVGYYDGASPNDSAVNLKPLKQKIVRLGELLVSAGFLNETDVMSCLELGLLTERPIGEVMVEQGYVGPEMLHVALTVQQMVEEKVYTKEEAAQVLAQIRDTNNIVPLVQDRLDGRYITGSYTVLRENDPDPLSPGEIYDEGVYAMSGEVDTQYAEQQGAAAGAASGPASGPGYDLNADLKEFESVAKAPKTGRHSSSRSRVPASEPAQADDEPSVVHTPPSPASNFEEAPSLESLMAGFGGETSDSIDAVGADTSFAPDSDFAADDNANGKSSPIVLTPPAASSSSAAVTPPEPKPSGLVLKEAPAHPFEALLLKAKVVSVEDIEHALEQARTNPLLLAEVLQQTGFLTEVGRTAALDCFNLVSEEKFDEEKGAKVLDHCINAGRLRNLTLGEALAELGMDIGYQQAEPEAAVSEVKEPALEPETPAELVIDSLITEVKVEEVKEEKEPAEAEGGDLLQLFGLNEGVSAASEAAVAKSAQTGSAAESLMASLTTPEDAKEAMQEAEADRPEAFQTTAVFKSIADEELDRASAMVIDEGGSLDTLLMRLEGTLTDDAAGDQEGTSKDETSKSTEPPNGLGQTVPDFATYIDSDDASNDLMLDRLIPSEGKGNGGDQDLTRKPTEEVDLRSLFSSLTVESPGRGGAAKPLVPSAAPSSTEKAKTAADSDVAAAAPLKPMTPSGAPQPIAASSGDTTAVGATAAAPAADVKVETTPDVKVEAAADTKTEEKVESRVEATSEAKPPASASLPESTAPAKADTADKLTVGGQSVAAPAAAVPSAPSVSDIVVPSPAAPADATPAAAAASAAAPADATPAPPLPAASSPLAAAPSPAATASPAAAAPVAKPKTEKSSANSSQAKLPTMSEEQLYAAKTAQISAMASALTKMAEMHYEAANYPEAQKAYERILSWRQGELGSSHIDLVDDLNNLAGVMCVQELFDQAEPMIRRAVDILENAEKLEPLRLADNLTSLAGLQFRLGVFEKAEPLLARSLALREQELGPDHTDLADALRDFAKLLKKLGKIEESEQYYSRAKVLIARRKAEEGA